MRRWPVWGASLLTFAACVDWNSLVANAKIEGGGDGGAFDGGLSDAGTPDGGGVGDDAGRCPPSGQDGGAPPKADGGFSYSRLIQIVNRSDAGLPAGYTVQVPATALLGRARPDFSDVHVFGADGGERNRIVDGLPCQPSLWIATDVSIPPGGTDTSDSVLYGSIGTSIPLSEPTLVFQFYDDFDGGSLSPQWLTAGNPTVDAGYLVLGQNDAVASDKSTDGISASAAVEARLELTSANCTSGTNQFFLGFMGQSNILFQPPWVLWLGDGSGMVYPQRYDGVSPCADFGVCSGSKIPQPSGFHTYLIHRAAAQTTFFFDAALSYLNSAASTGVPYSITIRNRLPCDVVVDWVRARNLLEVDPSVVLEAEVVLP